MKNIGQDVAYLDQAEFKAFWDADAKRVEDAVRRSARCERKRWSGGEGGSVNLRRDHVGGGAFVVAGALVLAVSGDLPFGTLASPGAGMLPKLVVGLMMAFGLILLARAGESPPLADLVWDDLPHALRVVAVTAAAIALYTWAGFVVTMSLLLFGLIFVVERRPLLPAAAFSVGVTVLAYVLFGTLLEIAAPARRLCSGGF